MARSVLLLYNAHKPEVLAALPEVRDLINRHGRVVAELEANGEPIDAAHGAGAEGAEGAGADLIVVLGGDGTLMGQSRRCVALGLPLLGVNLGKLGFMAEFDLPDLRVQAESLFDGSALLVQDRPMLRVTVLDPDPEPGAQGVSSAAAHSLDLPLHRTLALNDAVVTAGPPYRMITLNLRIDGHRGPQVVGDGLIVCTPIGSTAYNVSSGGPIVSPDLSTMTITPIAPHSLSFRPVVVPGVSTIELHLARVNDCPRSEDAPDEACASGGTALVLDGQVSTPLRTGQTVRIRQHARPVRFVRNPRSNYWQTLMTKMRWASPPAIRTR